MPRQDPKDPVLATTRKAFHDYNVLERFEAGIQLVGTATIAVEGLTFSPPSAFPHLVVRRIAFVPLVCRPAIRLEPCVVTYAIVQCAIRQGVNDKSICRTRLQRRNLQTIHCRTAESCRRGVFCEERQRLTDIGIQVRLRRCRRSTAAVTAISEVEK